MAVNALVLELCVALMDSAHLELIGSRISCGEIFVLSSFSMLLCTQDKVNAYS